MRYAVADPTVAVNTVYVLRTAFGDGPIPKAVIVRVEPAPIATEEGPAGGF